MRMFVLIVGLLIFVGVGTGLWLNATTDLGNWTCVWLGITSAYVFITLYATTMIIRRRNG